MDEKIVKHLLIVAQSRSLRDGLHALVDAIAQTTVIEETDDLSVALETVSQHHPDLLLLDGNISAEDLWVFLRQVRLRSPHTQRAMLVGSTEQQQEIVAPCAEEIWINGALPANLIAGIEKLLAPLTSESGLEVLS